MKFMKKQQIWINDIVDTIQLEIQYDLSDYLFKLIWRIYYGITKRL